MSDAPACVVHFEADGWVNLYICGKPVRFFCIDERTPHDRVFQVSHQIEPDELVKLIGDSPIGSAHDDRHKAIERRVIAAMEGRSHLEVVPDVP